MIDPLRPDAREAISRCRQAGTVLMVMELHRLTGHLFAAARNLGASENKYSIAIYPVTTNHPEY
jgi:hypothetical protein